MGKIQYKNYCVKECYYNNIVHYLNRRCVTEQECGSVNFSDPTPGKFLSGKLLDNRECVLECPKGYEEIASAGGVSTCDPCDGHCKKICPGLMVDGVEASTQLKGCTRIQGSLKIQIRGYTPKLASQLEKNLDMIEEIDDYLVVAYTYSLLSLNFFRSLKTINGNKLEESQYALVVKSNENIGDLWNKTVKIGNSEARVLFHYNPKLCPHKIREFVANSNITTSSSTNDIGITNGDKVPCNQKKLTVKIQKRSNSSVTIVWENFLRNLTDPRHLLNYEVSYKEAPNNVSPYDDRDPCGRDDWKVMDVPKMQYQLTDKEKEPEWEEEKLINNLEYFTRYALYVKTVVIPDENSPNNNTGAESDVLYFITLPDEPDNPKGLSLTATSSSDVTVTWYPPDKPNGVLDIYEIYMKAIPEDPDFQDQRNYCTDRRRGDNNKLPEQSTTESLVSRYTGGNSIDPQEECCTCSSSPTKNRPRQFEEVQEENDIENAIVNKVFIENPNYKVSEEEMANAVRKRRRRKRRATGEESSPDSNEIVFPGDSRVRDEPSGRRPGSDLKLVEHLPVSNSTSGLPLSIILRNLTHYTRYKIGVVACRKKSPDIDNDTRICSQMADDHVQTKPLPKADEINATSVAHNITGGTFRLHWEEPPHPNGVVLAYEILVKGSGDSKDSFPIRCVTRKQFQESKNNYTYPDKLRAGSYSYSIRTISLAQESSYIMGNFAVTEEGDAFTSATYILLAIVLPIFIILILGLLLGFYYVRRNGIVISRLGFVTSANPDYIQNVDIPEEWEVPRDKVELKKELGQGSFGMVYEGVLCDFIPSISRMKCAVKTVAREAPSEDRARFLQEALIMTQMNTHHVVKLLGVISKTQPTFVVMELMLLGDLKKYLRSRRPEEVGSKGLPPPTLKEIIRMAAEIADGMAYLDSHSLVHRDLAARNCMVSENVTVKVGDFGMTKDVFETEYYRKATKGLLPVRWMAPESIRDGVFSIKSDCWSFGVVLWEMATLAASPYQGFTNDQVLRYVRDGGVMERPEGCPNQLYEMMLRCWQFEARNRPTFAEILDWLVASLDPDFQQVSFYHSPKGIEYRTQVQHRPTAEELITQSTPLRATMESDDDEDVDDYDEGQDVHGFPFTYGGDSESGILLQDKTCNGALPRVSYTSGYNSNITASNGSSGVPTTVNNNRMQNAVQQNVPFVSINVGEPRSNNSNGLTQRTNSRPDYLGSISNERSNSPTYPDKLPHSASSGQISGGKVTPVNPGATNAPQSNCPSNENSKALSINYSSDGSKYGNGGAPSGGGSGSGTVSPVGPGANTGANGYLLRRSPVTDTYPTNRTTPL
ncbi:unnamed protein product [Allacma fusca]|uniref:Tyrosine-protein kinase receptor n=1 Tax=Allacma fusca TaxID=39272 RepID=A0A8J2NWZ4_9HEXA|nr:unnamed protein product [Allacma fusca]